MTDDFQSKADLYFQHLDSLMKGKTTMSNSPKKATTPADVAAKAAEEKIVVPAQTTVEISEDGVTITESTETKDAPELTVIEGETDPKKSLKERLSETTEKLKEHKKALALTIAAVGVATIAVVRYAKNQAEKVLDEVSVDVDLNQVKKLLAEDKHTISEMADILGVPTAALQRALDNESNRIGG